MTHGWTQVDKIDPQSAGRGLAVLFTALVFRMLGVVFAVSGGNLNKKEKIFMAFAWLPKAAVQVRLYFKSVCCNVYTLSSLMHAGGNWSGLPRQCEEVQQARVGTDGTRDTHPCGLESYHHLVFFVTSD